MNPEQATSEWQDEVVTLDAEETAPPPATTPITLIESMPSYFLKFTLFRLWKMLPGEESRTLLEKLMTRLRQYQRSQIERLTEEHEEEKRTALDELRRELFTPTTPRSPDETTSNETRFADLAHERYMTPERALGWALVSYSIGLGPHRYDVRVAPYEDRGLQERRRHRETGTLTVVPGAGSPGLIKRKERDCERDYIFCEADILTESCRDGIFVLSEGQDVEFTPTLHAASDITLPQGMPVVFLPSQRFHR